MEKTKVVYTTATDNDANTLFGIYLQTIGHRDASFDDFIHFLTTESDKRLSFLELNCNYELIEKEDFTILKYELKQITE